MEAESRLRDFILKTLLSGWGTVAADTPLFASGLLDSIGKLKLVLYVEKTFSVRIEAEDIATGRLETISSIVALIDSRKKNAKG